jgi:hypothetical protein
MMMMMMMLLLVFLILQIDFEFVTSKYASTAIISQFLPFDSTTVTWTQLGSDIDGVQSNDESGTSVALSANGNTLIIGAPFYDGINGTDSRHARVFRYHPTKAIWESASGDIPTATDLFDGTTSDDQAGSSVAISADGTRIAIGSPKYDGINGINSGHIRVFQQQQPNIIRHNNNNISNTPTNINIPTTPWVRIDTDNMLDGENAFDQSAFAVEMNVDGTIVAIGARFNNGNQNCCTNTGHVRVYQQIRYINTTPPSSSSWKQMGSDIDGEGINDESGYRHSVALSSSGTIVAIGAYRNDNLNGGINSGHVRVYQYQPLAVDRLQYDWVQMGSDIDGIAPNDQFGWSVAVSANGTILAVGAPGSNTNTGQVRVFQFKENEDWIQIGSSINGTSSNQQFGYSVEISSDGTIIAIGAPFASGTELQSGQVHVFQQQQQQQPALLSSVVWIPIGPVINGEAESDRSGYALAMSADGTIIAIGAYFNDGNNGMNTNSGHVRVYQMTIGNPTTTTAPLSSPPTQSPVVVDQGRCGLFGLRIFCPRRNECGLIRRLFQIKGC